MIKLSNGRELVYVVASGALAFDGKGWPWERPLVWFGLIRPELFTVFIKSLTRHPRVGNLKWRKPWECVRLLRGGGAVNKVGLTNPGIEWWCKEVGSKIDFARYPVAGSIVGNKEELVEMARMLNMYNLAALEVNFSCPNAGPLASADLVIDAIKAVFDVSNHPLIVKVSVDQPYLEIAMGLKGIAEAVSLNSVPWKVVYGDKQSPLHKLEKRVQGGGGGVSGIPAQVYNWSAAAKLVAQGLLPVIAPSIMRFEDMQRVRDFGAKAISFGAIHLRTPWKPTAFVKREKKK